MRKLLQIGLLAAAFLGQPRAEIIDRTVAVIGERPILQSQVELQVRLEAMFNEQPIEAGPLARHEALDRLIERRILQSDMDLAGYRPVSLGDLDKAFSDLAGQRFAGGSFSDALVRYGVNKDEVRGFLEEQMNFARYVEFRFRTGLDVSDAAIEARYKEDYAKLDPAPTLEQVAAQIREQILDEQVERMLDERVKLLRAETRVERLEHIGTRPAAQPDELEVPQ